MNQGKFFSFTMMNFRIYNYKAINEYEKVYDLEYLSGLVFYS